ncbi:DUF4381 domain-containing protein [Shimia aestuarii]|uniref:DUF4381 domain-containing protein n=1 Tax=Shimia aestuarii TaxID=254406 RepID=A0A1I4RN41_9RHOB|nr:DUF4381 domain-containing protein [Shimia aestuarii]SFM53632.1 protein of unknown function [Shimia aestuarii]
MSETADTVEYVTLVDLINQLQEVPDPAPVSMVPQTQGWIVLAGFLLAALLLLLRAVLRRHRANAYRRAALAALRDAGDDPVAVSAILKRAALAAFPRAQVASLTGNGWLAFLEDTSQAAGFRDGPGQALADAAYSPNPQLVHGLNALACEWVRGHVVGGRA